jgi:hypothetical protein
VEAQMLITNLQARIRKQPWFAKRVAELMKNPAKSQIQAESEQMTIETNCFVEAMWGWDDSMCTCKEENCEHCDKMIETILSKYLAK